MIEDIEDINTEAGAKMATAAIPEQPDREWWHWWRRPDNPEPVILLWQPEYRVWSQSGMAVTWTTRDLLYIKYSYWKPVADPNTDVMSE